MEQIDGYALSTIVRAYYLMQKHRLMTMDRNDRDCKPHKDIRIFPFYRSRTEREKPSTSDVPCDLLIVHQEDLGITCYDSSSRRVRKLEVDDLVYSSNFKKRLL